MIKLLIKMFVKDYEDVKNPEVRTAYGVFAGGLGIVCNIFLFAAKLVVGILTASVSIIADAVNNLSDAGASIITMIGFKLAAKPADYKHPYGHGRIEYIAGFMVSSVIVIMGVELLKTSVDKILHPSFMKFSIVSVIILVLSVAVKLWMAAYNRYMGKLVDSSAMMATATDSLSDVLATSVVIVGVIISMVFGISVDGYAGSIVALLIIFAGFSAAKETIQPLLGEPPEREFVSKIEELCLADEHIIGVHDLIVHNYGPGRVYASVHAEVPYNMDILEAHECIDEAERRISEKMKCFVTIHMDPIINDDETINSLKEFTKECIKEVDPTISMHDFRVVKGPVHTNLIFDVVVSYGYSMTDDELIEAIQKKITEKQINCHAVINVDKDHTNTMRHQDQ